MLLSVFKCKGVNYLPNYSWFFSFFEGHCFSIGGVFAYLFWLRRQLDQRVLLSLL